MRHIRDRLGSYFVKNIFYTRNWSKSKEQEKECPNHGMGVPLSLHPRRVCTSQAHHHSLLIVYSWSLNIRVQSDMMSGLIRNVTLSRT